MSNEKLRSQLVEMIQAAGQEVVDRAEEIVGNDDYLTNLRIVIDWATATDNYDISQAIPTIEVTKEHYSKNAVKLFESRM